MTNWIPQSYLWYPMPDEGEPRVGQMRFTTDNPEKAEMGS
jgi:hypothetical protein